MHESEVHDLSDDADYAASQQQGSVMITRSYNNNSSSRRSEADGGELVFLKENVSIHPTQYASERISGRLMLLKQDTDLLLSWIPYKAQNSNARISEKDMDLYTIRAVSFMEIRSIRRHNPPFGWQYIIVVLSSGLAFPPLYFYNGGVRELLATIKHHVLLVRSADDASVFIVNDFRDPLQRTLSSLELTGVISVANGMSGVAPAPGSPSFEMAMEGSINDGSGVTQYNQRFRPKMNDPARDLSIQILEKFSLVTKFARDTTSQLFNDGFMANERSHHSQSGSDHHHEAVECDPEPVPVPVPVPAPVPSDPLELDRLTREWGKPRQSPLGPDEWASFLDSEGHVKDSTALRKRIFYGGIEHRLREEVWALLLGYHDFDSTYAEREYLRSVKKSEYETIKSQWQSISSEQAKRFSKFRERKVLIEKDVVRTDRSFSYYDGEDNANVNLLQNILLTFSFYNFDLGYCQGMSDLLSPILFVMKDESESFWCFVALMERLGPNFNRDQNGMHSQLFALSKLMELLDSPLHDYLKENDCLNFFFCFRWILIQFKRELEYEKTMHLWEILWTHHLSEHFHLYMCIAILKRYRSKIMGEWMDFDTLLKFINDLSGHIDVDAVVGDAEALCLCAGEKGAACIPPGTPPSLAVHDDDQLYLQQDDL